MTRHRVLILGAAGRDFHNFNTIFRNDPSVEVVGFTATQIPKIEGRRYPPSLAGKHYPEGIKIHPEADLEKLIKELKVDECVFAYSDVPYDTVGHLSARVNAAGADFRLIGCRENLIESTKPVIAITAVRTGCGKSQTARFVADALKAAGKKIVAIRHPMPYGDLEKQAVQRFADKSDLDKHQCTFEEREEYESHIEQGNIVYAGVDYGRIIEQAQEEADVIIWDGGNNDFPFYKPDLWIVVADPLRAGHETRYYPGEVNFRAADVIVVNKVETAKKEDVETVLENARKLNPNATVIRTRSVVTVPDPEQIRGKRVLCIEDGPTLTHGEMTFGAGQVAAERYGAAEVVDPRPNAVGSIKDTLIKYPHVGVLLPAMGYFPEQVRDLEQSINKTDCDLVLVATPFDLTRMLKIDKPAVRVEYASEQVEGDPSLKDAVLKAVGA